MQDDITEDLYNLGMATTTGKDVLYQINSTIKYTADTNKILTEQAQTITQANTCLIEMGDNRSNTVVK